MRAIFDGEELRVWDLPLHEAIANHQLTMAEYFLVVKGAAVDSLSFGITPLMVACHLVLPNAVVLLLRHGSNPNYPPNFNKKTRAILSKLTKYQRNCRGTVTNLPMDRGSTRIKTLSEKSDYILQLLVESGLTDPQNRFLHRSTMRVHFSQATQQRFKSLNLEIRPLRILALTKVRENIRLRCGGIGFFASVCDLNIPDSVKKQISFRVRP